MQDETRDRVLHWLSVFGPKKLGQLESYLELTRDFKESRESAAERLGVSLRTVERYESDIRAAMECA